jgi:hypothetical protein
MSYDIYLYNKRFLDRAIERDSGDWTNADPLGEQALKTIRDRLAAKGYMLESEGADCQEYIHPNAKWAIQVSIFKGEVSFSIPYWDDAENAIIAACADAKEFATAAGLGLYDPQVDGKRGR